MERMKRWLSLALALVLVLSYVPTNVFATEAGEELVPQETTAPAETTAEETTIPVETDTATDFEVMVLTESAVMDVDLPSSEELFAGYAESVLYGMGGVSTFATGGRSAGSNLTGDNKKVYNALIPFIQKIAKGERASTVIKLGYSRQEETDQYIYFTGTDSEFSLRDVMEALLLDYPYEMYWYNQLGYCGLVSGSYDNKLEWLKISMPVSVSYSSGQFTADTAKTGAVTSAATKAAAIVAKYASASDYEKLVGYRNEICALVSYDKTAASGADGYFNNTDANPWQLIYVFDGNTATNVVCEGYSKAFQYLCDMGGVPCISVRGTMHYPNGNGGHMWNIVTLDGKNYLVDVTNSDEGTLGQNGELFLAGAAGSPASGYSFTAGGKTVSYGYGYNTPNIWTTEELTLAAKSYSTDVTIYLVPGAKWKEANAWFAAYYWGGSSGAGFVKMEADGMFYTAEIPAGHNNIIFLRKDPANTGLDWNGEWARIPDQKLDPAKPVFVRDAEWATTGTWIAYPTSFDYYLAGYLNNANVGIEGAANKAANKFADGKVDVTLTADSYVCLGVQAGNTSLGNYMTQSYVSSGNTATMYANGIDKLFVPAGTYRFTLVTNADGSVTLSYGCPHSMTYHAAEEATCGSAGNVAYYYCSVCKKNFSDEAGTNELAKVSIDALGHEMEHVEAKEASCGVPGNVEHYYCDVCDGYFLDEDGNNATTQQAVITIKNHLNQQKLRKDATCTEDGYTFHYKCDYCGATFEDQEGTKPIDPTLTSNGHTYGEDGFCANEANGTVCGAYEPAAGSGTKADPYLIENAGQLFWFAAVVNEGYGNVARNSSAWGKLTAHIEIPDGKAWTPIGVQTYYGSFDGDHYSVSNMHCSGDYSYVGMFGKVEGAELKNIGVGESSFTTTDTIYGYAGGIVGYAYGQNNDVTVTGCTVSNTTVTGDEAGGIVGRMDSFPEITGCRTSSNTITSNSDYGAAGGIAGTMRQGGYITGCIGNGTITGYYSGGIAGYVENQAGPYANRTNSIGLCDGYGTIGDANSQFTGGIVGYVSATTNLYIDNCRSGNSTLTAAYNVNSRIGGLLGGAYGDRDRTVKVTNSYTYNITMGVSLTNVAYLACGQYVTVENCYTNKNDDPLTVGCSTRKVAYKTNEQFASGEVCWLLNGEKSDGAWGQSLGTASGIFPNQGDRKVYKVAIDCQGSMGYSNTESTGTPAHSYDENGFCINKADYVVCDAYEPAVKVTEDNYTELGLTDAYIGYYAIQNAGNLYWFADKVDNENAAYRYANAVLTADIMIPSKPTGTRYWNPIGSVDAKYSGIFDGNGKAIEDIFAGDTTADMVGLVAWLTEDGVVKNVTVTGVSLNGNDTVGAIVAYNEGTVELCGNTASVIGKGISIGGIVGVNAGTVRNCWNTGRISGEDAGGIVGDNEPGATVENCWYTGELEGTNAGGIVGFHQTGATAENCYTTQETAIATAEGTVSKAETKTADQFASGEVAYLLGGVWGQNIDNGETPQTVPALSGTKVYQIAGDCMGNPGYSNTESTEIPAHSYVNGFCVNETNGVVCDDYQPATLVTEDNYTELDLTADYVGYYAISNAGNLYWFADKVDTENDTYGSAKVVLAADITVNEGEITASSTDVRVWNPIGDKTNIFNGTFDGNGKTVSGLYYNNSENNYVGLFARVSERGVVKNVTVTKSYFCGYYHVAGIVGLNEGTVTDCVNRAMMDCDGYSGGIVGNNQGNISNCLNYGTIHGSGNQGGIAGYNSGCVELCGNEGSISTGWMHAGGIVGDNTGTVRNCWNTGDVYAKKNCAGGIAGSNMKYSGNTVPVVENCWSTGSVTPVEQPAVGGIVGRSQDSSQNNCYSVMKPVGQIEDENGVSTVENMEAKTLEQFASGEVAYLLGGVWGQDLDNGKTVQTVPSFDGADVYYGYFNCGSTEAAYTNTTVSAEPMEHDYENGFCELVAGESHYEPAIPVTEDNYTELGLSAEYIGYYAITNAGNLYWFSDKVDNENATYGSVNVVLTADVTVNEGTVTASSTGMRDWNPIGWFSSTSDDRAAFSGTFDGNGKSISGLYFNNKDINGVSLFAITGETALVKNVTVTNSYFCGGYNNSAVVAINLGTVSSCFNEATLKGDAQIGGIVGRNLGLVELCGNTGAITGDTRSVGGIVGENKNTVRNCWNTGNIQVRYYYAGGITGANNSVRTDGTAALTENCWSTGTVVNLEKSSAGGIVGAAWVNLGGVRNCYSLMKPVGLIRDAHPVTNAEQKTLDQFASGEVAYLLRTRAAEGTDVWGQNIDNDQTRQNVPALNGADVYQIPVDCMGTLGYSNTNITEVPDHSYDDNGFCANTNNGVVCDAYEPATLVTEDNYTELGLTADYVGYYAISNAGQLYWFADKVDNDNANFGAVNVVLTDNITVNTGTMDANTTGARVWNPIGWYNSSSNNVAFSGIFDGNGKTVSGLYYNNSADTSNYIGLVACVAEGGTVKHVTLSDSYILGYQFVGSIAGINYGTVTGCVNNAAIGGDGCQGGIAGENHGTVELCGNTGTITNTWCYSGGIVGRSYGIIRNCWNTGSFRGDTKYAGGIVGTQSVMPDLDSLTENCWSMGQMADMRCGGIAGWLKGPVTVRNCYSDEGTLVGETSNNAGSPTMTNVQYKSTAAFASGEVAYLLRTRAAEGTDVWGQNIDNDQTRQNVPALNGADVYQVVVDCAGSFGYSNTDADKIVHNYDDNGFCVNENAEGGLCDAYEPAVLVTAENREELGLAESYIGYYAITNAGNLYWFADKVDNENATYGSVNVVLTADITVNEGQITAESTGLREWNPIGSNLNEFGGTFDGNTKTVSGLFADSIYIDAGLVGSLAEGGVVKNVTLTNSYLYAPSNVGGIVGYNKGTVTGCYNEATIEGGDGLGGIVGWNYGTVELCGNTGGVTGKDDLVGGITGMNKGTVRNCWNTGNVSSVNNYAGGIVGWQARGVNDTQTILLENCWSTGTVTCEKNSTAGGIIGYATGAVTVQNCYSIMAPIGEADANVTQSEVEQKTADQFTSGAVAYLLGGVWGQDLDNGKDVQDVPTFTGAPVYYGYSSCAETEAKYTNNANVSADPIEHDWEYTADGASITGECKNECGTDGGEVTLVLDGSAVYDGSEKTVKADGSLKGIDTLPAVTYEGDRINVGTFTAYLTLEDGTKAQLEVTITAKEITPTIEGVRSTYSYNGEAIKPAVTVKDGDKVLTEGTDYEVTYGENLTTETDGYVKVTLKGNYEGEARQDFTIAPKIITPTVEGLEESYVYTGEQIRPVLTIKDGDTVLVAGTDYFVLYGNNTEVGQGSITISCQGNYLHTSTVYFDITPKAITPVVEGVEDSYTYTGEAIQPTVTVKDGDKVLTAGTDYDVAYGENKNVGEGNVKVTLKGNYEGEATETFSITAKTLAITGMTGTDKVYDGTTDADVELLVDGIVASDDVEVSFEAAYESANAGTHRIHVTGIKLSGDDASNYVIASETTGSGEIARATVTVTSVTVADKTYDGTTDAEVTNVAYTGIVTGEDVIVTAAGAFVSAASGENKTVGLTYELSGEGKENYILAETTGTTTASINPVAVDEVMKPLDSVTPDNVASDDLPTIEDVREELEDALEDPGLTDEQKKDIEDALDELDELEKAVDDAHDAVDDPSVEDTLDVTDENVTKDDREDLEKAKDVLEDALENFGDNYTDEEKKTIQENIDRIEDALEALDKVEAVEDMIEALPETVEPDDEETTAAIEEAKKAYDELTDHEKSLISQENKEKLDGLLAAMVDYKIVAGDGAVWTKGSNKTLEFTANGAYGKFKGIEIDGVAVDAEQYTAVSGSTIITLKAACLEELDVGAHSIKILYTDGEATGAFRVNPNPDSPATGDSANVALWSGIALISLAAAAALVLGKKRFTV